MATTTHHMATHDVEVGGVPFRLMREPGSAFVGILRMGRVVGGEIVGYIARMNTDRPEPRWLSRVPEWRDNATNGLRSLYHAAVAFHAEQVQAEARQVVTGRG